ncbi:heterogeneous nuclear ribonucleoprotein M-like protein [Turdus rufiventris]|nr:heterogeneous nuclear ribonucleoprotein M-like protein [Turdus rufiventris]
MEPPPAAAAATAAAPPAPNGAAGAGGPPPKSDGERPTPNEKKKEKGMKRGGNRFEPYASPAKRYRAFITNIPFDVKWQSLKDLVKEKELLLSVLAPRQSSSKPQESARGILALEVVVEFKMEESMKKAAEVLNKHSLGGRPLKVKEDPDGEHARRAMQKVMAAGGMGIGPGPGGPGMINIPPSILNNPNIPNEIIHALQAGRLGSTVFVANLDYKVGWKKLKEVFSMAGVVVRADILEDKDGKSRGIGTVTFEQAIEAVQAIYGDRTDTFDHTLCCNVRLIIRCGFYMDKEREVAGTRKCGLYSVWLLIVKLLYFNYLYYRNYRNHRNDGYYRI